LYNRRRHGDGLRAAGGLAALNHGRGHGHGRLRGVVAEDVPGHAPEAFIPGGLYRPLDNGLGRDLGCVAADLSLTHPAHHLIGRLLGPGPDADQLADPRQKGDQELTKAHGSSPAAPVQYAAPGPGTQIAPFPASARSCRMKP